MADQLVRGFRSRLTTTLDGVLRKALLDVMNIFEVTVQDFKLVMEQKEGEIQKLQMELQSAELKLKKRLCESEGESTTQPPMKRIAKSQKPKSMAKVSQEPAYWCAPLGFETTPKKEVTVCPSVQLRPLSIPVRNIPLLKNEVVNCDLDLYLKTRKRRVSKRLSALKEGINPILGTKVQVPARQSQRLRNNMSTVTLTIEQQSPGEIQKESVLTTRTTMDEKKKRKRRKKWSQGICQSRASCNGCKRTFSNLRCYLNHSSSCQGVLELLDNTPTCAQTQTVIKVEHTPCSISSMDPNRHFPH